MIGPRLLLVALLSFSGAAFAAVSDSVPSAPLPLGTDGSSPPGEITLGPGLSLSGDVGASPVNSTLPN